jgi:hypothetical protein
MSASERASSFLLSSSRSPNKPGMTASPIYMEKGIAPFFFAKKKKQKLFNHYENTLFIFRNAKFNTPYKKGYYAIYSLER